MNLQLIGISDRGVANKERLEISVLVDTNLYYYVVFDTRYSTPLAVNNIPELAFWFTSFPVKAGDRVVLFTGQGQQISIPVLGQTIHYFFWGQPTTLWNNTGDCAVLLEISSWQTSKYE